jgi:hypothetical protein
MKFKEKSDVSFSKSEQKKDFIYFLINSNNEVVYIGKTKGFPTCLINHSNKDYTTVRAICVDESESGEMLGNYIVKYKPKYNSCVTGYFSLTKTRDAMRNRTGDLSCSVSTVKKMLVKYNIPWVLSSQGCIRIPPDSVKMLCDIYEERDDD